MNRDSKKPPSGFFYFPDFISLKEEALLVDEISQLSWNEIRMHGLVARRRVVHFGLNYHYTSHSVMPGLLPPEFLQTIIERVAHQMSLKVKDIVQILITEYSIGAGINWHRDAPIFGNVFGVSLLSPTKFKLRLQKESTYEVFKIELAPRSGYMLSKASRLIWQHSISPVKQKRYSITFRTLSK